MQIKSSFVVKAKNNNAFKTREKDDKDLEFGAVIENNEANYPKTGNWSREKPFINDEICIKCGICERNCPEGVIEIKKIGGKKKTTVNYLYCKGCGICVAVCPKNAIKMK